MLDDKNEAAAVPEKAPPVQPLTAEELIAALGQLVARAKATGVGQLHAMADAHVKKGLDMIDSFLTALEGAGQKRK